MKSKFSVKSALLVFMLFFLFIGCALPVLAWESSSNGVTVYSDSQYNSEDWHYGDDIYAYNANDFPVFIDVHLTEYDNVQFSVGGSVGPGETRKIGWIVCADSSQGWYYNVDWSWQEEPRAF